MNLARIGLVGLICLIGPVAAMADDAPQSENPAGYRKFAISYKAKDEERRRNVFLWYPSAKAAERFDYRMQIGFVGSSRSNQFRIAGMAQILALPKEAASDEEYSPRKTGVLPTHP